MRKKTRSPRRARVGQRDRKVYDKDEKQQSDAGKKQRKIEREERRIEKATARLAVLKAPDGVPTGPRIVEDHSLLPTVVDKVIEYKGGVVPDYAIHNPGCSKRRRKAAEKAGSSSTPSKSSSRIYEPSERVAAVTEQRTKVLKEKAKKMASGS